jgi:hypothetical protein
VSATPSLSQSSDIPEALLASLTRSPEKQHLYRTDPYFRHGLRQAPVDFVLGVTFMVLKPDAVVGRRIDPTVKFLHENGFVTTGAATFTFSPLLTREVWRYQFNVATWERAEVVDVLLPSGESLLLTLHDERWEPGAVPAACRLTALKGPAERRRRGSDDLRSRLGSPATLLNFVHTADEPADVVRELALFDLSAGSRSLAHALARCPVKEGMLAAIVRRLHRQQPAHDLDAMRSWRRLARHADPDVARAVRRALDDEAHNGWRVLLELCRERRLSPPALWDVLAIATAQIDSDVPGLRPVIPAVPAAAWLSAEGTRG